MCSEFHACWKGVLPQCECENTVTNGTSFACRLAKCFSAFTSVVYASCRRHHDRACSMYWTRLVYERAVLVFDRTVPVLCVIDIAWVTWALMTSWTITKTSAATGATRLASSSTNRWPPTKWQVLRVPTNRADVIVRKKPLVQHRRWR